MKIRKLEPEALIGRSLRDHLQGWWFVEGLGEDHLKVSKPGLQQAGRLLLSILPRCKLYPTHEEVEARYPRLLTAMRYAAILSPSEAADALIGYLVNGSSYMGSEAVAHFGGAGAVIEHALRCRSAVQRSRRERSMTRSGPRHKPICVKAQTVSVDPFDANSEDAQTVIYAIKAFSYLLTGSSMMEKHYSFDEFARIVEQHCTSHARTRETAAALRRVHACNCPLSLVGAA